MANAVMPQNTQMPVDGSYGQGNLPAYPPPGQPYYDDGGMPGQGGGAPMYQGQPPNQMAGGGPPPMKQPPESQMRQHKLLLGNEEEYGREGEGCTPLGIFVAIFSVLLIVCTFPFSLLFCFKVVTEYERAVQFRLGRVLPGAKGPGMICIIPCIERLVKVDLRTLTFNVPPQEILTKDSVTVVVDAIVYYRIFKPMTSVLKVQNAFYSTTLLAQTTLRNVLGTMHLNEALGNKEEVAHQIAKILDVGTDPWGVKVERVEITDVRLPADLQRALAKEAEAWREANAKVIHAEGEKKAARGLKEASMVLCENNTTLKLRYLQELQTIAAEKDSTILFPLPLDSIGTFGGIFDARSGQSKELLEVSHIDVRFTTPDMKVSGNKRPIIGHTTYSETKIPVATYSGPKIPDTSDSGTKIPDTTNSGTKIPDTTDIGTKI